MIDRDAHALNRAAWNAITPVHNAHKHDQAGFLRDGGTTLFPEELELLGELRGKTLAHLCCNSGQDTLSLAALGAVVVGVDISDEAIDFATRLSAESGIAGRFVRADAYDWLESTTERFDRVLMSYGAVGWLSDLPLLMRGIARILKPGGRLVIMELHPLVFCIDVSGRMIFPYFSPPVEDEGLADYVTQSDGALAPMGYVAEGPAVPVSRCVSTCWTTAELVHETAAAGLTVEKLREWPYTNGWKPFAECAPLPGRRWTLPDPVPATPLMLGLSAILPA